MKKQNVLITGASGYLGGIVSRELNKTGKYNCVLATRSPDSFTIIDDLKNLETRQFDISQPEKYSSCLKDIDSVIHLVSLSNQECEKNPELAQKINTQLAQEFIEAAIKASVKQFIYLSTFHVYGSDNEGLITEETPAHPVSIYARTHLETENFLLNKIKENKINGAIIRLSNSIGAPVTEAKEAWALVANDLCRQAVKKKSLTLNSSGLQKRDFIAVPCVGHAVDFLLNHAEWKNNAAPVFNLGSEKTITILELAEKVQNICLKRFGYKPPLTRKEEMPTAAQPSFTFCTAKLRSIGFQLKTTIDEEIGNTFQSLTN